MHEAKLLIQPYPVTLQVSTIFYLETGVGDWLPRIKRFSVAGPQELSHTNRDGWRTAWTQAMRERENAQSIWRESLDLKNYICSYN